MDYVKRRVVYTRFIYTFQSLNMCFGGVFTVLKVKICFLDVLQLCLKECAACDCQNNKLYVYMVIIVALLIHKFTFIKKTCTVMKGSVSASHCLYSINE